MSNTCRAFILYNDFLPPTPEVHQGWESLSLGDYDGVTVGRNLFEKMSVILGLYGSFI